MNPEACLPVTAPADFESLRNAAGEACGLLKTLANPDRLLLLCHLSQGELCVGDLEKVTGVKQPTLSQQLTVLREEKLVSTRRQGKQIFYRLESYEALTVLHALYGLYCGRRPQLEI